MAKTLITQAYRETDRAELHQHDLALSVCANSYPTCLRDVFSILCRLIVGKIAATTDSEPLWFSSSVQPHQHTWACKSWGKAFYSALSPWRAMVHLSGFTQQCPQARKTYNQWQRLRCPHGAVWRWWSPSQLPLGLEKQKHEWRPAVYQLRYQ